MFWDYDDGRDPKRTLGERNRQILWIRAKKRCENPACGRKIEYIDMEVGHKTAWSKKGRTTLANSKCLCHNCNKRQGNDSWPVFLKKQGVVEPKTKAKQVLETFTLKQLKLLASKYKIKVSGHIEEDWFSSRKVAPTKKEYVNKLLKVVTPSDLRSLPKEPPKPTKKRRRKSQSNSIFDLFTL